MIIRERLKSDGVDINTTDFAQVVDFAEQKGIGLSKEKEEIYYTSIIDILAHSEERLALIGKDLVITQSKKDIATLVSGLKAGMENIYIQKKRAEIYQYKGLMGEIWPFNKLPQIDLDPSKNGFPVQIAMGVVDEVLFSLWDIGYDINAGMESGELFTTIKMTLKEVMSWHFLRELGKEIGISVTDLLTNHDTTQGDVVYKKTRQLLIALGIIALLKSGLKVAVKKIVKMVEKQGNKENGKNDEKRTKQVNPVNSSLIKGVSHAI